MGELASVIFTAEFLGNSLRFATPLILAAMGGVVNERTGVLNLGIDGMMLIGAFAAFAGSYFTGNPWMGVLIAVISCMLLGLLHAFTTITLVMNQVVVAVAINTFSMGLASSLLRTLFGTSTNALRSPGFSEIGWPQALKDLPFFGPVFFQQTIFVYIAILSVPVIWWVFYKTTWGLKIRAVGEYPKAAETMGVNVAKVRYLALLFAGAMGGLSGAALSITGLNTFIDNMTAGRGFIAFACIIFGRFHPLGAGLGALMFGLAQGLQLRIQTVGIPVAYQIPIMFPYILTLVLLVVMGSGAVPAAWGVPYYPDEE
ncbi:ABC transporter permease [Clostridia bacterium]|nr:ABC transporter permease [Clostridia bacterium]